MKATKDRNDRNMTPEGCFEMTSEEKKILKRFNASQSRSKFTPDWGPDLYQLVRDLPVEKYRTTFMGIPYFFVRFILPQRYKDLAYVGGVGHSETLTLWRMINGLDEVESDQLIEICSHVDVRSIFVEQNQSCIRLIAEYVYNCRSVLIPVKNFFLSGKAFTYDTTAESILTNVWRHFGDNVFYVFKGKS